MVELRHRLLQFGEDSRELEKHRLERKTGERLDYVIECSFAQECLASLLERNRTDHNDRQTRVLLSNRSKRGGSVDAVLFGHHQVEGKEIRLDNLEQLERHRRITRIRDDFASDAFEMVMNQVTHK